MRVALAILSLIVFESTFAAEATRILTCRDQGWVSKVVELENALTEGRGNILEMAPPYRGYEISIIAYRAPDWTPKELPKKEDGTPDLEKLEKMSYTFSANVWVYGDNELKLVAGSAGNKKYVEGQGCWQSGGGFRGSSDFKIDFVGGFKDQRADSNISFNLTKADGTTERVQLRGYSCFYGF